MLLLPAAYSGKIALQGPQSGSVKRSITGLSGERRAPRVSVSPWRPLRLKAGAVDRPAAPPPWWWGTVLGSRRYPRGSVASSASRRTRSRPFWPSRWRRNHHWPAKSPSTTTPPRRPSELGERASRASLPRWGRQPSLPLPDDEASHGSEHPVAGKGLPPSRGGVQLAEAVAVRLAPAGQVMPIPHQEEQQG